MILEEYYLAFKTISIVFDNALINIIFYFKIISSLSTCFW